MAKVKIEHIKQVVLTLTEEEAGVLLTVCNNIGGDQDGPRGKIDAIGEALNSECISPQGKRDRTESQRIQTLYLTEDNNDDDDDNDC